MTRYFAWVAVLLMACPLVLRAADTTIEVREGDDWTKVTLVRKEGRRALIRYPDGTEEWVGPDRLRGGDTPAPADANGKPGSTTAPAATPTVKAFSVDQTVEYKTWNRWEPVQIKQIQRGWVLIAYDKGKRQRWIEPWALRVVGSTYDIQGFGPGGNDAQIGEVAPTDPPKKPPRQTGNQFAVQPPGETPEKPEDKKREERPVTPLDLTKAVAPQPASEALKLAPKAPASAFVTGSFHCGDTPLSGFIACPDTPNIGLAASGGHFRKPTTLARVDLTTGRQLDSRSIECDGGPISGAASDGRYVLTLAAVGRHQFSLYEYEKSAYTLKSTWQPGQGGIYITYLGLAGPKQIIYADSTGSVYEVDAEKNSAIGVVKTPEKSNVYLHPTGQVMGVITTAGTAMLIRTSDFSIITELPDAAPKGRIVTDPTVSYAAYVTSAGAVRVIRIADNSVLGTIWIGSSFTGQLDLVDADNLLLDRTRLYDVKSGLPIWTYTIPKDTKSLSLPDGTIAFAMPAANGTSSVVVATLPDAPAKAAAKTADKDKFMLVPGTAVKLDADYGAYGAEANKAQEIFTKSVAAAGLNIVGDEQPFHLSLRVTDGPAEKRDFITTGWPPYRREIYGVVAPSRIATATLTCLGIPVWTQQVHYQAEGELHVRQGQTVQDAANEAATPKAASLEQLTIPSYVLKGATPGTVAALGSSEITDRKIVPAAKVPALPPVKPPTPPIKRPTGGKST